MTSLHDTAGQLDSHHKMLVTFAGKGPNGPEYHTPFGRLTEAQIAAMLEADLKAEMAAEAAREPAPLPPAGNGQGERTETGRTVAVAPAVPSPAPGPLTRRGTPRIRQRLVDWRDAAVMIARGVGITYVAEDAGVSEHTILRNLRRSPRFRQWIREAEAAVEADAARHAAWLRLQAAAKLADRAECSDPKTLQHLARPMADLARDRIGEAAEPRPEPAFARLSGFARRDFTRKGPARSGTP